MSHLIELLPWDSEFFGLPIGRVIPTKLSEELATRLLQEALRAGLQCLYFEASPDDPMTVIIAEKYDFSLVDVRVVLEHPFDRRPAPAPRYLLPPELIVNAPREDELPRLREISAQISYTSRFTFDQKFVRGASERLYHIWIEKACQGWANRVLVARWHEAGEAAGLIACALRDRTAHIQLAGVHLEHRQRGVGTALVQAALDWARARQTHSMQVITQARNVPAQRLYQQMGFFTRSMTLYYHKWLSL